MSIKTFIFGVTHSSHKENKNPPSMASSNDISDVGVSTSTSTEGTTNPYVRGAEGKKLWDDRYMNMKEMIRRWQMAFAVASITAIILALVTAKIALESHVEPFVVETNKGMPYAIRPVDATMSANDQRLVNFAVDQFVINTRTVLSDPKAEGAMLDKAYAYAADEALSMLQDYFANHDPYKTAQQYTVSVNIVNAMPLSKNTWQVTWDETQHFASDQQPVTTRWMANVTYRMGAINPDFVEQNPFGLYITHLSWSKTQQS